jgi:type IV pilus assembly protein PilF
MKVIQIILFSLLPLVIVGCVTTTDEPPVDTDRVVDTYVQLGLGYLQEGRKDQARYNLLKAVEADPRSPEANNAIALLYQTEGETESAETHYRRAIAADSRFNQARYNYAKMLLSLERYADAEDQYAHLSEDVDYRLRGQSFLGLGLALEAQGDLPEAREAFTRAYQRDTRLAVALLQLGELAYMEDDYVTAKEFLDRFETQTGATPRSLELGYELARIFNDQDSEVSYSMALRNMFPDSREAREHILSIQGRQ